MEILDQVHSNDIHAWFDKATVFQRMNMANPMQLAAPNIGIAASNFGTLTGTSNLRASSRLNLRADCLVGVKQ